MRLRPHVRNPGLVSVAATVDTTGPILNPNFRAVPCSVVASAASALFRNAMRPGKAVISAFRNEEKKEESACGGEMELPPVAGARELLSDGVR